MIPRIEDAVIKALESRICASIPETTPGAADQPETFVTTIETRKFSQNVQEQQTIKIFGEVEAEISVILYSKKRYDYSAMLADFAETPFLALPGGAVASIEIERNEAVEGPYLTNDGWGFTVRYQIFSIEDGTEWKTPEVGGGNVDRDELFLLPEPSQPNEPEAHF